MKTQYVVGRPNTNIMQLIKSWQEGKRIRKYVLKITRVEILT